MKVSPSLENTKTIPSSKFDQIFPRARLPGGGGEGRAMKNKGTKNDADNKQHSKKNWYTFSEKYHMSKNTKN